MELSTEEQERYNRHLILEGFGKEAQLKLKGARVLVVGAGGLGCPALLYLAAAGVGCIGIADNDVVSLSNLQRQVLYTSEDVGKGKALTAAKHLQTLNGNLSALAINERIERTNILSWLNGYDVVLDCTDNFSSRYLLNDACVIGGKPLVYGAIFKFEGQVSVFNLHDGPTYRCLFPQFPTASEMLSCSDVGVIGVLPGIVGTWQAAEAIKIITGIGQPLKGVLMSLDFLNNKVSFFKFKSDEKNKHIDVLGSYNIECPLLPGEVDAATLKEWIEENKVQLIDVREPFEFEKSNIGGRLIPLSELSSRIHEVDPAVLTVVHCESGVRSAKAIEIIKSEYPAIGIYNLKNGLKDFDLF